MRTLIKLMREDVSGLTNMTVTSGVALQALMLLVLTLLHFCPQLQNLMTSVQQWDTQSRVVITRG
jgi:hypothetical protein